VSLREIRIAAGQRNSSALQFHFGNREGLLLALVDRHMPEIFAIQEELYAELVAAGRDEELPALVEVMVRPTAEYLRRGPSARAWVRISAERLARPETGPAQMAGHVRPVGIEVGTRVHRHLATFLDDDLALDRLLSVLVSTHHLCADRSRVEEAPPGATARAPLPFDRWLANLVDMAIGALSVEPGAASRGGRPRT
jgi:AcrR family transcriptional regulator